jgi:biotin synthase
MLRCQGPELYELLARAGRLTLERRSMHVHLCAIVNARSGDCDQDCAFCSQSKRSGAEIDHYGLMEARQMVDAGREAADFGAHRFSVVTSGGAVRRAEHLDRICGALAEVRSSTNVETCASLGLLDTDGLARLRDSGVTRYHHNLETAESHWERICTTRPWADSLVTIRAAQVAGLELCVGGIFGMGESLDQRVELLESIRGLDVESVPLNFLHPIEGTPLAQLAELTPFDCLRIIAVARLMMPDAEIRICGGRQHNLRDLQSWILMAGVDGIMIGNYLTTAGRTVSDDLQMIRDAGLIPDPSGRVP